MKISDLENKLGHLNKFNHNSSEKAVNEGFNQDLYHGTNADFDEFDYKFVGKGVNQYGYGFYFTNELETASSYGKKVIVAKVNLKKPIVMNYNDVPTDGFPTLTEEQVKKIIRMAPDWEDVLKFSYGTSYISSETSLNNAARTIAVARGDSFFYLLNGFFGNSPELFNMAYYTVTGYDGVIVKWDYGKEFHVAWFKNQIKVKK